MKKRMKKHKRKSKTVNTVIIISLIVLGIAILINSKLLQFLSAVVLLFSLIAKFIVEAKPEDTERGAC